MPKRSSTDLSIAQLRSILSDRQSELKKLVKQRKRAQKELDRIDAQIAQLGGTASGRTSAGGRPRNAMSLVEALTKVLQGAGKPMSVGEITDAVRASGYRSSSPSFRLIVNQTLIREKKLFSPTGRGIYQARK
jgi:septal ring factor EnvC (AmiA/AmiB activator)